MTDTTIVWLRRDLRLDDNAALSEATCRATNVAVVFVFDPEILVRQESPGGRRRLAFLAAALKELDSELRQLGSALIVRHGDPSAELPLLARRLSATSVYCNRDYTPFARRRDAQVAEALAAQGVEFQDFKDHVIFAGDEIERTKGIPYRVFTPFSKRWRQYLMPRHFVERKVYKDRFVSGDIATSCSRHWDEYAQIAGAGLWLNPGRKAGLEQLENFVPEVRNYRQHRDQPALQATSGLSAHFKFGTVSIRDAWRATASLTGEGVETWRNEIIWREFYQATVLRFPHVTRRNFNPATDGIAWPGSAAHMVAWCAGQTGFPLVDAAMRELVATGWMHNRLRMVVASFLTKDLLIDWRQGAAWFREQLLDYDFAANNGGWQWAASTGCDAQPYFRVFNPVTQSQKFDAKGEYIRRWLPELAAFSDADIHWPHHVDDLKWRQAGVRRGIDYPLPIVNHAVQRKRAIGLFRIA